MGGLIHKFVCNCMGGVVRLVMHSYGRCVTGMGNYMHQQTRDRPRRPRRVRLRSRWEMWRELLLVPHSGKSEDLCGKWEFHFSRK